MKNKEKQIRVRDVQDVLYIIGGRWRGAITASLCDSPKRFNDLKRDLGSITPKVLANELAILQENCLVEHKDFIYQLTPHGMSLEPVIEEMVKWGRKHRKVIIENNDSDKTSPENAQ